MLRRLHTNNGHQDRPNAKLELRQALDTVPPLICQPDNTYPPHSAPILSSVSLKSPCYLYLDLSSKSSFPSSGGSGGASGSRGVGDRVCRSSFSSNECSVDPLSLAYVRQRLGNKTISGPRPLRICTFSLRPLHRAACMYPRSQPLCDWRFVTKCLPSGAMTTLTA